MSMPKFHELMRPALVLLDKQGQCTVAELEAFAAKEFSMTDEELAERLDKSGQRRIRNRIGWAVTDLEKAKYLAYGPKKGTYLATDEGRAFLATHPKPFKPADLYAESADFRAWKDAYKAKKASDDDPVSPQPLQVEATPQEMMESAYEEMRAALGDELLQRVYGQDPYEFEHTVAKLLKAMGYGDTVGQSIVVTPKSGDDGVDGFVREDRLGFDVVYYQAKRWALDRVVTRPDVNTFAGALLNKQTSKGLFITTAKFSKKAVDYAQSLTQPRIILVDGAKLAELMIDHNVGVGVVETFEVKAIDSDFFGDD